MYAPKQLFCAFTKISGKTSHSVQDIRMKPTAIDGLAELP
jgi:hypothetical protein